MPAALLPWPIWLDGLGGRPEEYRRSSVIDAIFSLADNGAKWRNVPADFPPGAPPTACSHGGGRMRSPRSTTTYATRCVWRTAATSIRPRRSSISRPCAPLKPSTPPPAGGMLSRRRTPVIFSSRAA
ncbi:transposase [Nocardia terpenica]